MSALGWLAGRALRLVTERRRAAFERAPPLAAQRAGLKALVSKAAATQFGLDHGFAEIDDIETFQARVPLRRYEDFWKEYWSETWPLLDDVSWPGRIPFFALTSGTTAGPSKRIPVSHEMIAANANAGKLTLAWHFRARPESRLTEGVTLMLGGSTAFETPAPGVGAGDLSGLATVTQPWYARWLTAPAGQDALLSDWDRKLERLSEIARSRTITGLTGTPSWTLLLLEAITRADPARRAAPLPELELYVHGGMSFRPYAHRFAEVIGPETRPDLREVFPASEGFFAAADAGPEEGMRLIHDSGIFYEFIPLDRVEDPAPPRLWLGAVETGVDYALAVSTNAGLWAYLVGDVVRFVSLDPPRLLVTGRTSWMLSPFGEHVLASELDRAVNAAAKATGVDVVEFSAAPEFPSGDQAAGRHVLAIELAPAQSLTPEAASRFAAEFDRTLKALNDDYAAKRAGDLGLRPPQLRIAASGAFTEWMRARGKLGGQHKVPRVLGDASDLPEAAET